MVRLAAARLEWLVAPVFQFILFMSMPPGRFLENLTPRHTGCQRFGQQKRHFRQVLPERALILKAAPLFILFLFIHPAAMQIKADAVRCAGLDENAAGLAAALGAHLNIVRAH